MNEVADLLWDHRANPFRVQAYGRGAETVRRLDHPIDEILQHQGVERLRKLPGIGDRLAIAIRDIVRIARPPILHRMRYLMSQAGVKLAMVSRRVRSRCGPASRRRSWTGFLTLLSFATRIFKFSVAIKPLNASSAWWLRR